MTKTQHPIDAKCKALVERDVAAVASDDFSPSFLRNATAFGASPRQRFDIVVNNLSGLAWTEKNIAMTSDGTPWRPMVHALDICKSIRMVLDAPVEKVSGEVFNVGSYDNNYTVRQIAETKMPDLNANDIEAASLIIAGTARSMGITVEG